MLLVYSSNITPRIEYIFDIILKEICGFTYKITTACDEYINYDGPSLNYSNKVLKEKEIRFQPGCLLFENTIIPQHPLLEKKNEVVSLLFRSENSTVPVSDPFAAAFFLVSRYEEYLPYIPDQFGRFEASSSVSFSFGLHKRPLVNEWAENIKALIIQLFPSLQFTQSKFSPIISIDIDQAYAFRHRGFFRNFLSFTNNIIHKRTKWLKSQLNTIVFGNIDPFDTYLYLKEAQINSGIPFIYFINIGSYTNYDKNLHFKNAALHQLVQKLVTYAQLGLHPSYYSNERSKNFLIEKERLQKTANTIITKSRQHFLKLKFPDTYRNLIDIGIKEDYTMGYATQPGFRAGICTPFYWFDLEKNCSTCLKVFPITFMDGTLVEDLRLSPIEALEQIESLITIVKKHNGFFLTIWHNHSVNNQFFWKGWKGVFEGMIEMIKN